MLINSVKDVASALGDLIHATKSASGKSINDPAMIYLKDSAKVSYHSQYFHHLFSALSRLQNPRFSDPSILISLTSMI